VDKIRYFNYHTQTFFKIEVCEEEKQEEKLQKEHEEKKKLCSERRYNITLGRRKINGSEGFCAVPARPSGTYGLEAR